MPSQQPGLFPAEATLPSLEQVSSDLSKKGNLIPVYQSISSDLITPMSAYLRLSAADPSEPSFLFESVLAGERIGRYSFLGSKPRKVLKTGISAVTMIDPLKVIEDDISQFEYVPIEGVPDFTGGAIGYVSYDCVQYFEPKTKRPLKDTLGIPESFFLWMDTILVFDHLYSTLKIVSHVVLPNNTATEDQVREAYTKAQGNIQRCLEIISSDHTPLPEQSPILLDQPSVSNVGQEGYEGFVTKLKEHIAKGDIIQAVPSQRIRKRTTLHPLNAYRKLRAVNPSPYMFYLDLIDFQVVGASPELLVKVENRKVVTHPIAGTRKRGKTQEEDLELEKDLVSDIKERSEHVMLVDLGRNDVNRVCDPHTVHVDSFMHTERFSHVMHLVSHVSGILRPDQTPFDAFRSIFPAGTVSGAPKIRAMELIYDLEKEKRGVYAGAVGYFGYSGGIDTCIAIRTMLFKDGEVILQAGGGIVHDSHPTAEFEETLNKLRANVTALEHAERHHYNQQNHS